ncbi:hypothetical protein AYI68_g1566 [Smittium mucronatum]|uniref:G domain-containing protein n=1 Tax=Smittium mucronatum TaxID=133383 RepID=A0A1R0H5B4_9FUNG|nr:hypothetical protein AYI68_g1566 [Smittium mucronatum]
MVVGPYSVGKSNFLQTILNSFRNATLIPDIEINNSNEDFTTISKPKSAQTLKSILKKASPPNINPYGLTPEMSIGRQNSRYLKDIFKSKNNQISGSNLPTEEMSDYPSQSVDFLDIFDSSASTNDFKKFTFKVKANESFFYQSEDDSNIELTLIDTPGFNISDTHDVRLKTRSICRYIQKFMEADIDDVGLML